MRRRGSGRGSLRSVAMALFPSAFAIVVAGVRRRSPLLTLVGGLLVVREIIRRLDPPRRQRIYEQTLGRGQKVMVGVVGAKRRGQRSR
jgi:hypothetical protein